MTFNTTANRSAAKRIFKTCAMAAGLGLMSLQAFAGDSALYGPTAPKGSTFVRVYNPVEFHLGRGGSRARNTEAGNEPQAGDQHDSGRNNPGIVRRRHHHASTDGASQNRQKGAHLDQRVATDQFALAQVLGQDRIFDRPEQR